LIGCRHVSIIKSRILFRIILPFTLLFALGTFIMWGSSALLVSHFFDEGLRLQLLRVANGISQSGFFLNPHVLNQVKGIVDADIVLCDPAGQVLSSTIDEQWLRTVPISSLITDGKKRSAGHEVAINGQNRWVVFQEVTLPDHGRAYISLWQPMGIANDFKHSISNLTALIAILGIVALAVAGYAVARSISIPVVQLARMTEKVASGDLHCRASIQGDDEIAQLGHSFNAMIDRLQESERKLVEAGQLAAVGQLAAGVAHEIKNPLTAIKMFVQVLQGRMVADSKNLETLGIVLSEINRLDRIVEQIVHRARPEDGIRLELTHPEELLGEVLQISHDSLRVAHIAVFTDFGRDMPMVALDRAKMKQVLWNIIVNAKDAMPLGGELRVTARHLSDQGMLELIVEDTGGGLAAGVEPEACFTSFFTTKPEGLGLGLTMSRKIVARHGGTLTLSPRAAGGVRVAVALPTSKA